MLRDPLRPQATLRPAPSGSSNLPEVVDPVWILKAIFLTLVAGLLCAWITVCAAFRATQWQLVLHPTRTFTTTPAALGLPVTEIRFGVDSTGQPQLDGWLLPTTATAPTALLLHGGSGTMADALAQARLLHQAGLNVLLFDYRGYGRSGGGHPTQTGMEADAETALDYLRQTQHLAAGNIILYGTGVGGALAVHLCAEYGNLGGLILDTPDGDFESRVAREPSTRLVPVALLFNQRFPLADPLHTLPIAKLLISRTRDSAPEEFERAADPKMTVEAPPGDDAAVVASIRRFVGGTTPSVLLPNNTVP